MKQFTFIELFSGVGGFRQALDELGGECVFSSEIDPHAVKAYKALYNGALELQGDITKIEAHDVPDHDVLVGGFPCQAFSVAGQRKGFEEARGTLFFEIARIASAKQPRLMLLENVKGLLSHDGGNTFETMCVVLNDIGYAIDFHVLNSKHYGVPQNRERIFIVCNRDAEHADWNVSGNGVEAKAKRRAQDLGIRTFNFDWPTNDTVMNRLRDILELNVDERYYLSEEKTAKLIAQLNGTHEGITEQFLIDDQGRTTKLLTPLQVSPTLRREMHGNEPRVVEPSTIVAGSLEHYCNDQMNRVYSVDGIAPTIIAVSGGGREAKIAEPIIEKVGHLPSDSGQTGAVYGTDGNAPTCLNQHGNVVTKIVEPCVNDRGNIRVNSEGIANTIDANYVKGMDNHGQRTMVLQRQFAGQYGVTEDITGTLQAARVDKVPMLVEKPDWIPGPDDINRTIRTSGKSSLDCKHNCDYIAEEVRPVLTPDPLYRIRKLTPLECWRLQGFSDEAHETVRAAGISDSQRYKQAGNAVTVNVIRAIGERLVPLLEIDFSEEVNRADIFSF